uniref:SEA domain-containing protein n=1 Tax=Octopus bimaculoides TaxID=37653 RepID=A0A0L8HAW9_OCTBM
MNGQAIDLFITEKFEIKMYGEYFSIKRSLWKPSLQLISLFISVFLLSALLIFLSLTLTSGNNFKRNSSLTDLSLLCDLETVTDPTTGH